MSTITIGGFLATLDRIVTGSKAAAWDVHGLTLGDPGAGAATVGVCHEVTEAVTAAVEASPVDLLVSYHPLLFKPTTRLVVGRSPAGRAYRLVRSGVSLAVAHTAFDAAPGGCADALAAALGLDVVTGFAPMTPAGTVKVVVFAPAEAVEEVAAAMAAAGAGVIGNYTGCSYRVDGTGAYLPGEGASPVVGVPGVPAREPETRLEMIAGVGAVEAVVAAMLAAHPYEEPAFDVYDSRSNLGMAGRVGRFSGDLAAVAARVRSELGETGVRVAGNPRHPIHRVAVVPGSGGSFLGEAVAAGADVLVTGDVGHHTVVEALDRGVTVIDAGHAPTERPGMRALVETVARIGVDVVDLTGFDPTPWR